ncbi:PRC-barrel domain-containing protein [Streptomyces sp. NPDC018693]|uniref:PRC-barrel domain-containing protein n=1 Tax=unclassified Streptomyces TaxID=2593676 RepID=UPI0037B0D89A
MTDLLDAGLELLDRQVLDSRGTPLGKVDDLLFTEADANGPPALTALLIGQRAFGARLGGRLGQWWTRLAERLSGRQGPFEVPVAAIDEIGTVVRLSSPAEAFPRLTAPERWLRRNVVSRLPGAFRESD